MIRRLIAQLFQTSFMPFVGVGGMGQGYKIEKSLRFRGAASATVARTFPIAGNRKTWTLSTWVKRGALGTIQYIFSGGSGSSDSFLNGLKFETNDSLYFVGGSGTNYRITTAVFRDPAAWYHIVLAFDTTQAEPLDRIKLYVNGVEQSYSTVTAPTQNLDYGINAAGGHRFGNWATGSSYLDGYLADINFIDGQALGPEVFGQINPTTGQWEPRGYSGAYGTNGFYLDFKDGTDLTSLGHDKSGNGNDWAVNGVSLTDGPTYDWMDDTPSNNFAVLNPLVPTSGTLSNGNLTQVGALGTAATMTSTIPTPPSGKWFVEGTVQSVSVPTGGAAIFGLGSTSAGVAIRRNLSGSTTSYGVYIDGVNTGDNTLGFTNGSIAGFAYDADAGTIEIYIDGDLKRTASVLPGQALGLSAGGGGSGGGCTINWNFGQRPFAYAPPAGYKNLCTKNLKDDTVSVSGSFTGNANANGPFIWCNGTPETLTINGNAVTWGTHADRLANGFKLRTNSASYNASGTNNWTATILSPSRKSSFRNQRAKVN